MLWSSGGEHHVLFLLRKSIQSLFMQMKFFPAPIQRIFRLNFGEIIMWNLHIDCCSIFNSNDALYIAHRALCHFYIVSPLFVCIVFSNGGTHWNLHMHKFHMKFGRSAMCESCGCFSIKNKHFRSHTELNVGRMNSREKPRQHRIHHQDLYWFSRYVYIELLYAPVFFRGAKSIKYRMRITILSCKSRVHFICV